MNKYTCIFGGGGIRGLAYVGAMEALKKLNIECDKYVGSSVGAIFAAFYALGYTPDEAKNIMLDFNALMFKDINFGINAEFAFSKGDIFENWIREIIEKIFYKEKYKKGENPPVAFRDINKDLYVCSTDMASNSKFTFSKQTTPDFEIAKAIRISACFPGLMKPIEYDNKLLVDGDLAKNLPLWKCADDLVTPDSRILEYRLEGCSDCKNFKNPIDYFNEVYSTMSYFSTEQVVDLYKEQDKIDYIVIDTKDVLILDFQMPAEKREQLSQNGYDTTMKYFTETLVEKKKKLLPLYTETLKMLKNLKISVKKGNAKKAKQTIFDYICTCSDDYMNMDFTFLEELKKFKTEFLNKINEDKIFHLETINNKTELNKIIQGLIEKCDNIITELQTDIEHFSAMKRN